MKFTAALIDFCSLTGGMFNVVVGFAHLDIWGVCFGCGLMLVYAGLTEPARRRLHREGR